MTSQAAAAAPDLQRRVPPMGGFNLTFLWLEIRRMVRNKRTMFFAIALPVLFFFAFGYSSRGQHIGGVSYEAYAAVNLACYGALIATAAGGAIVALERSQGWSRQLRLTPLRPGAYVVIKVLTAMSLGAVSVFVEFVVAAAVGTKMSVLTWVACGVLAWVCSFVFAALGLFVGYLLPSENVMQIMGAAVAMLALLGGLFVPLSVWGSTFRDIARWTPAYGVGEIARAPLHAEHFDWAAIPNVIVWIAIFMIGTGLLFRNDTKRT